MKVAVYPGSFDPLTYGHLDIIDRARRLFDKVIVAVLNNPDKHPVFSVAERMKLIADCTLDYDNVIVGSFGGLLVDFAKAQGASVIVRGLRTVSDFENETQMAQMNQQLYDGAITVFIPTDPSKAFISSTLVKQIAGNGGLLAPFVPEPVENALRHKYL